MAKAGELEKEGTKLYGFAPIPFLLLLLHCMEETEEESSSITVNSIGSGNSTFMYAERAGYITVEMQKMDAGNENAYSWTVENGLHKLFSGDFGYTGPQTDDPQYYLYEYDPVGYSYYNLDGTSVTEKEYLEAHSEAYSWRSDGSYTIITLTEEDAIGQGIAEAVEYLRNMN